MASNAIESPDWSFKSIICSVQTNLGNRLYDPGITEYRTTTYVMI